MNRIQTMSTRRRLRGIFSAIVPLFVVVAFLTSNSDLQALQPLFCTVTRVIDGDTMIVACGEGQSEKIRLIGVDTPETKHPTKPVQYFGKEASAFTKKMCQGKKAKLEFDQAYAAKKHRGVYGRLLAYVYIEKPDGTWFDLNAELIKQGFAHAYTRFPFSRMEEFRRLEREAREAGRGLWGEAGNPAPQRAPKPPTATKGQRYEKNGQCLIKGNINSRGMKIYHQPGMRYYKQTKISEAKGERWFCTEEEAQAAGWRKSNQ